MQVYALVCLFVCMSVCKCSRESRVFVVAKCIIFNVVLNGHKIYIIILQSLQWFLNKSLQYLMATAVNPFLSSTDCIKIIKIINRIAPAAPEHGWRRAA